jgi:hypothetical protein
MAVPAASQCLPKRVFVCLLAFAMLGRPERAVGWPLERFRGVGFSGIYPSRVTGSWCSMINCLPRGMDYMSKRVFAMRRT